MNTGFRSPGTLHRPLDCEMEGINGSWNLDEYDSLTSGASRASSNTINLRGSLRPSSSSSELTISDTRQSGVARLRDDVNLSCNNGNKTDHVVNRSKMRNCSCLKTRGESRNSAVSRHWNPSWLSTTTMVSFFVVQIIFVVALLIIRKVSISNHGFLILTTSHYAWTYGPTAVLTIVGSVWGQIEYWCKVLQPWKELKNGPASARDTLLLDYISPILPKTIWRATRSKHIPVVLCLVAGLVLKIITVASTGLLVLGTSKLTHNNVVLELRSEFIVIDDWILTSSFDSITESAVDFETFALVKEGLQFPDGILDDMAFQRFGVPANSSFSGTLSSIKAEIDTFQPINQCQQANLTLLNVTNVGADVDNERLQINATASWQSCSSNQPVQFYFPAYTNSTRKLYGSAPAQVGCPSNDSAQWALTAVFDVRYNQSDIASAAITSDYNTTTGSWGIQVISPTAVICDISYSMARANVTYDFSKVPTGITVESKNSPNEQNRLLDNLTENDYAWRVVGDADDAIDLFGDVRSAGLDEPDTFFGLMAALANATVFEAFLGNASKMSAAAEDTLTYIGVQVANEFLIHNVSRPLDGSAISTSPRLVISALSFWAMFSGSLLIAAAGLGLVRIRSRDVSPIRLESIGDTAVIMSQSSELQGLLQHYGHAPDDILVKSLASRKFHSQGPDAEKGFCIIPSAENRNDGAAEELTAEESTATIITWWRPLAFRLWFFSVIFGLPLAIIATLEILQHLSNRSSGISTMSSPNSLMSTFAIRIAPSAILTLVALLYESLKFNILLLTPFLRLKKGSAKNVESINVNLLGQPAIWAFISALRRHQWPAALATLASIVGSFLTIVASGLLITDSSPGPISVPVSQFDRFDPSWPNSLTEDGGAASLLPSFDLLNLPFPAWTTSELTIPIVNISSQDLDRISVSSQPSISLVLPAVRADLQCAFVGENQTSFTSTQDGLIYVGGSSQLPATCNVNATSIEWSLAVWLVEGTGWVGQMLDLHPGQTPSFGEMKYPGQENSPPGCPSLAFTFGNYTFDNDFLVSVSHEDFSVMYCSQMMAEVQTNVTLSVPDFTIISAVADELSVKYIASGADGNTAFPWRLQAGLNMGAAVWNGPFSFGGADAFDMAQYPNYDYVIDAFYALLLTEAPAPQALLGIQNRGLYLEAVQKFYRRYMAQVASLVMRVPLDVADTKQFDAIWVNPDRFLLRLDQHSKLLLQILLGIMSASGLAAYLLMGSKKVLPHNPSSIAGTASLLAGSTMCSQDLVCAGKCMNKICDKCYWESWVFSLRWWSNTKQTGQRFGIDIEAAGAKENK